MNLAKIINKLNALGISTKPMRTQNKQIFLLSLLANRKELRINVPDSENVKIMLRTDKRFRQAVIVLEEAGRTFEETLTLKHLNCGSTSEMGIAFSHAATDKNYINNLALKKQVSFCDKDILSFYFNELEDALEETRTNVEDSSFKIKELKFIPDLSCTLSNVIRFKIKATISVKCPASKNYFLVGYDEDHLFVSQLPSKPKSVKDAHRILTPKNLRNRKDVKRVGEYFFAPLTAKEKKHFVENPPAFNAWLQHDWFHQKGELDIYSGNHEASLVYTGTMGTPDRYVVVAGTILDTEGRHKPLFLTEMHRVYLNNELPSNNSEIWD